MKKKLLFLVIIFFMIISVCKANECSVISGTGKEIGDEIDCSGERFYIVRDNGNTLSAIAKYNLNVGDNLESTSIINYEGTPNSSETEQYMADYCHNTYGDNFNYKIAANNNTSVNFMCIYRYTPNNGTIKQDELYVGMSKENAEGEFIKDYGILELGSYQFIPQSTNYLNTFYDASLIENESIRNYLNSYKEYLIESNINVLDIDILAVSDIIHILEKDNISENDITMALTESSDWVYPIRFNYPHDAIGNLNYIPDKNYEWLYNTTYWTKTVNSSLVPVMPDPSGTRGMPPTPSVFFITSEGKLCKTQYDSSFIGAGIRPVITIPKQSYMIETKTDGNGNVTAEKISAPEGDLIKFTVEPKPGYVLGEVRVIDSNGSVVKFTDYTFTMPASDVIIEATFLPINPKTKSFVSIIIVLLSIISGILLLIMNKQRKELE